MIIVELVYCRVLIKFVTELFYHDCSGNEISTSRPSKKLSKTARRYNNTLIQEVINNCLEGKEKFLSVIWISVKHLTLWGLMQCFLSCIITKVFAVKASHSLEIGILTWRILRV